MTTQLPERLRDLADDAPGPLSPAGLWQAGRRQHRRRQRTVGALVGAVVALTAGAGVGDWQSRRPDPAAPPATPSGPMSIPDRIFDPSPWLPSTDKPGRLVAVMPEVVRQHFPFGSERSAVVGIAAGSQRYTFLDLPRSEPDPTTALSPDGLHLAYTITSHTAQKPDLPNPPTGVAILDLVTGAVELHPIPSQVGLDTVGLGWADTDHLLMYANKTPAGGYAGKVVRSLGRDFRVGDPTARSVPLSVIDYLVDPGLMAAPGFVVSGGSRRLSLWDPSLRHSSTLRLSRGLGFGGAIDTDVTAVAGVGGNRSPGPLISGHIHHGRAVMRDIPGDGNFEKVLGWVDGSHVIADRYAGHEELVRVDTRTGQVRELSRLDTDVDIAQDAIYGGATVHAVTPPRPWNPRAVVAWTLVGVGLVAFFGYVALSSWRQRVRR